MTAVLPVNSLTSYAIRIPRDFGQAVGGAGSPSKLARGTARYRSASSYATVYSNEIECLLIKVTAGEYVGWGEAQTPIAPEICHSILEHLAGPLLIGQNALSPKDVYNNLYDAMRVRGHSGGFYLDALAAIDIALWDICGKAANRPISSLLNQDAKALIPLYISGVTGTDVTEQVDYAVRLATEGAQAFKIFWPSSLQEGFSLVSQIRNKLPEVDIYVDALWRLSRHEAEYYATALGEQRVGWLEAPFMPEDLAAHVWLRSVSPIPIAIGESYRSQVEFQRIFNAGAADVLQPDLGRCGISGSYSVAQIAGSKNLSFAPHVSISLGPQLAAAIHVSAASPALIRAEVNPQILAVAQQFVQIPLDAGNAQFVTPTLSGLGISISESRLQPYIAAKATVS
jgi:D-galactarolactone cycloisomerase